VVRDPVRNFLWGHLGLREDDPKNHAAPPAVPDCADLPYYLRATFAWKMGLPFGLRDCNRGSSEQPPLAVPLVSQDEPVAGNDPLEGRFRKFLRLLANKVHSGSARTALDDDQTDFYPVKLARDVLRPGVIYADPYGHVMMVAKWVEQTGAKAGASSPWTASPTIPWPQALLGGTFLFASDVKSAGPGFKAFRPWKSPPRMARRSRCPTTRSAMTVASRPFRPSRPACL